MHLKGGTVVKLFDLLLLRRLLQAALADVKSLDASELRVNVACQLRIFHLGLNGVSNKIKLPRLMSASLTLHLVAIN